MSTTDGGADNAPIQEVQVVAKRPQALQYLRQISCILSRPDGKAIDFSKFRVVFNIRRGDLQSPNTCDVRIYNLSDNTANQVQREFTYISLQAGYQDNLGQIFKGTVKQIRKGRVDQKDSYLDITAADGDEAYNFAPVIGSLNAGSSAVNAYNFFTKTLVPYGITAPPKVPSFLPTSGGVRGQVFCGMFKDHMRVFANANNCSWSFQDQELTLIKNGGYLGPTVPVISPTSGLIGVPEQTQGGISLRTLLNPRLKIGQLVQLQATVNKQRLNTTFTPDGSGTAENASLGLDAFDPRLQRDSPYYGARTYQGGDGSGLYYVMVAEHTGDTRGEPWYTDLVCLAIDATMIPSGTLNKQVTLGADDILG